MKNIEKLQKLTELLKNIEGINDINISKTGSLYFYIGNDDFDGYVKVSNHQLCENSRGKKYMVKKSNHELENYEMIQDSNNIYDLTFANLEKYSFEFGKSKPAPEYWFVASGNWSINNMYNSLKNNLCFYLKK